MRYIIFLIFATLLSAKDEIEISAKNFVANEKDGISIFSGDVVILRGQDKLSSQELKIYFDKDKKPTKYEAIGEVKIDIEITKKRYLGSANRAEYDVLNDLYIFQGDSEISQKESENRVIGEKIVVDRKSGKIRVDGKDDKPVKFIFSIEE